MAPIYTRTGDQGETGLLDGSRVSKDHSRVAACGELDELSAALGVAGAQRPDPKLAELLREVQRDLLAAGAEIADPRGSDEDRRVGAGISRERVERLEAAIDEWAAPLPALTRFTLPGGCSAGAQLHLARTVCRRAERRLVTLRNETAIDPLLLAYLNRLSDLLFVLARHANQEAGTPEQLW
jgi:cob(I)alamin adenosyltransferase